MKKRRLEARILGALWEDACTEDQLSRLLEESRTAILAGCRLLKKCRLVVKKNSRWEICWVDGRSKKTWNQSNSSLKKFMDAFNRKADVVGFFEGRKTHSGKKGSESEWKAGATLLVAKGRQYSAYLEVLGLAALPGMKELKVARNIRMKQVHPDVGGNSADAALINEAYEKLSELISK